MFSTIQTTAMIIVTRVKTSPALVPKALEPPTPPKAPARPPPLPRWIRTRQIRNSEVSDDQDVRAGRSGSCARRMSFDGSAEV